MKIQLINQSNVSATDFNNIVEAMKQYVAIVAKAWKIDAEVTTDAGDWLVYITEQYRNVGAKGYHTVKGGVPVAYISPKASGTTAYGRYWKPISIRGKVILAGRYTEGLVTVVGHEIAEMLADPFIQTISSVDFKGRRWLVEVADHVRGYYMVINANGKNCILPDVTTPAYYDQNGTAPYDICGKIQAPFILAPQGYGYYYDSTNKLIKL